MIAFAIKKTQFFQVHAIFVRCNKDMEKVIQHNQEDEMALGLVQNKELVNLLHDNIDSDRLIWDVNYRKKVKEFLNDDVTDSIYKSK